MILFLDGWGIYGLDGGTLAFAHFWTWMLILILVFLFFEPVGMVLPFSFPSLLIFLIPVICLFVCLFVCKGRGQR